MTELEQLIQRANTAYWEHNKPIMSDTDYDELIKRLKIENPDSPLLVAIGGVTGKYVHKIPMLSLNKAHTNDEVWKWAGTLPDDSFIDIEPKLDGIAGKIENGRISTRGDGHYGRDVTHIAPIIEIYDYNISKGYTLEEFLKEEHSFPVLGEILISYDNFNKWFASGKILQQDGSKYLNPRNAVAGMVNRKTVEDLPEKLLTFVLYESFIYYAKKDFRYEFIPLAIEQVAKTFINKYPIDGVVFTLPPSSEDYSKMGFTVHHPLGAIAYKFGNRSNIGIVDSVEWQQGREVLTPVLNLRDKLDFDDVWISKATLHNYEQFCKASLNVGDEVGIERANDVIPKFVGVGEKGNGPKLEAPTRCPYCNSKVEIIGKDLVCLNYECPGKIVPRLVYAAKCLRIDGIGPKTAKLLHEKLGIKYLWQLLEYNYQSNIECLPGFTDYTADLLYKNIKNAIGTVYDWEVAASCCIPGIGPELLKQWYATGFKLDQQVLQFNNLSNFSDKRKLIIEQFVSNHSDDILNAFKYFKPIPFVVKSVKGVICLTGNGDRSRSELARLLEEKGYKFTNTISTNVDMLVTNDLNSKSAKMDFAKNHNIPIRTYNQLYKELQI